MNHSILVIGGGIAGMRAAVELLLQGFKIFLLEEGLCIGGKVEIIDTLFPTKEHAACALQPLILELKSNSNAMILTSSKVISLQGIPGDFKAKISTEQVTEKGDSERPELSIGAVIIAGGPDQERGESLSFLGIELDDKGYPKTNPHTGHPCQTSREGVFMCGATQGPKEIGELVIQACAASCGAAVFPGLTRIDETAQAVETRLLPVKVTDEPKIAVVIDQGGADITDVLDLDELVEYTRTLPSVMHVEITPSATDGFKIKDLLETGNFNRLIVAGPSPITDEHLFQLQAEAAGLNRFLVEIVNLHNQCARVHSGDIAAANEKAKVLMKIGVARVRHLEPLGELKISITQSCLVVGGSAAGIACAARLGEMGLKVHLVDHNPNLRQIPGNDHPLVESCLTKLLSNDNVEVHAPATVGDVQGRIGCFEVMLNEQNRKTKLEVGAIVVATRTGIEKSPDGSAFTEALGLKKGPDGLYVSTEGILNLLDFDTAGIFNCGPARAILETEGEIVEGEATASRAACIINSNSMSRPPTISDVIDKNCDGCAYCVDPCPTRSITLLEFMLHGEIKKVVEVSERTCIGCGICMSTCPKKGIDVKNFKMESFSDMAKAALENEGSQSVIISFCCNRCAYPGADAAGSAGIQYPASIRIIRTVCSGMIHPNIIMDALTQGADGVLLCGCHPGNCRSREGIRKAQDRSETITLMLEDFGLEAERFRLEHIAASEGEKFAKVVEEMTSVLSSLGPSPYKQSP